jgi:hypothetical protein
MIGRTDGTLSIGPQGARASLPLGPLPPARLAASRGRATQYYLELSDIEGTVNPGVVYGVYVDLPVDAGDAEREQRRVGLVSFFGVEHSTSAGSAAPQQLRYNFDITELMEAQRAHGDPTELQVVLLPIEGMEDDSAAAAAPPPVRVGTVAVLTV